MSTVIILLDYNEEQEIIKQEELAKQFISLSSPDVSFSSPTITNLDRDEKIEKQNKNILSIEKSAILSSLLSKDNSDNIIDILSSDESTDDDDEDHVGSDKSSAEYSSSNYSSPTFSPYFSSFGNCMIISTAVDQLTAGEETSDEAESEDGNEILHEICEFNAKHAAFFQNTLKFMDDENIEQFQMNDLQTNTIIQSTASFHSTYKYGQRIDALINSDRNVSLMRDGFDHVTATTKMECDKIIQRRVCFAPEQSLNLIKLFCRNQPIYPCYVTFQPYMKKLLEISQNHFCNKEMKKLIPLQRKPFYNSLSDYKAFLREKLYFSWLDFLQGYLQSLKVNLNEHLEILCAKTSTSSIELTLLNFTTSNYPRIATTRQIPLHTFVLIIPKQLLKGSGK